MQEITIRYKTERDLTDTQVISSASLPQIEATKRYIDDETAEYRVQSHYLLNREALNVIMRGPIDEVPGDWRDVYSGLRGINYSPRILRKLGEYAGVSHELNGFRRSVSQLADTMKRNVHQTVSTAHAPVFRYQDAQQYIFESLKTYDSRKLLGLLKGFGFSSEVAKRLTQYIHDDSNDMTALNELNAIGLEDDFLQLEKEIMNAAIIGESDDRMIIELVHYIQARDFIGFREVNRYENDQLTGGAKDYSAYVRKEDVPVGVPVDEAEIFIGNQLRDDDRKTGLTRNRIDFISGHDAVYARPLIAWKKRDGERSFVFSPQKFDRPLVESHSSAFDSPKRLSSIAGAAIAANKLGKEIDYNETLSNLLSRENDVNLKIARAGLLPLVLRYEENQLLSHSYFEKIENQLDGKVQ